jgi:hypothetical protein
MDLAAGMVARAGTVHQAMVEAVDTAATQAAAPP